VEAAISATMPTQLETVLLARIRQVRRLTGGATWARGTLWVR
jgi:hypothetical protein